MPQKIGKVDPKAPIIILDVGNSAIKIATWHDDKVQASLAVAADDLQGFQNSYNAHLDEGPAGKAVATAISSVNPVALQRIQSHIEARLNRDPLVIGDRLPAPIEVDLDSPQSVGTDRLCAAGAAYDRLQTGCVIIDFGSAVTVDLVSDDGVFMGGAILPGMKMQLRALHEYAAALPEVEPGFPDLPYGRSTEAAMQNGVCRGLAGSVRWLVEAYATKINRWPQTLATGGDATLMTPHCDFLDTWVSDLVLRGIGVAYSKQMSRVMGKA